MNSNLLESILPSSVQMAPKSAQSAVVGSTTVTAALESGSTVIAQPTLLPFSCPLSLLHCSSVYHEGMIP